MLRMRTVNGVIAAAVVAFGMSACGDILTVSDPERYTNEDLDQALEAVANGVEGALHEVVDNWVIDQALLSDEYQHTGTWSGYDEVDHGRFQYGTSSQDGEFNAWLRARWFAQDAEERFLRVMGDEAANDPLMAQVHMSEGLIDLWLGMSFCEAPAEPSGPAVPDTQILQQAVEKLTRAMATAGAAGTPEYAVAAQAGRARAHLLLGNYSEAMSDAQAIPDDFSYDAVFNEQSSNSVVTLTTKTFNQAAGLMHSWWDRIDLAEEPGFVRDPWTDQPDRRMPVFYDGDIATDNETPHRSQWKYTQRTSDIPMLHSDGMRLIEAEVLMRQDDFEGATAILNDLRAAVDLDPLDVPADEATMLAYLLTERQAELFMEGMRAIDLHRFGLVGEVFGALNDPERPAADRPTKWPMSDNEATLNPQIENRLEARCLPRA